MRSTELTWLSARCMRHRLLFQSRFEYCSDQFGEVKTWRRSNLIILLLALAMGTVAALMARSWIAAHETTATGPATGTIVVATAPLPFGTVLTPDNVSEISWADPKLPEGAFATKTDLLKDGRRVVLTTAMERSEMVLPAEELPHRGSGPRFRGSLKKASVR